jgi:hypothetical protein
VPGLALLVPLAYYFVLSESDPGWAIARRQNELPPHPVAGVVIALAPIVALALAGVARECRGLQERALLLWPVAALLVHFVFSPTIPSHAFEGMSIPLAILAVRGVCRLRIPAAGVAALVALFVLPGVEVTTSFMRQEIRSDAESHTVGKDDAAALRYLERDPRAGAVLTSLRMGMVVPAHTGRATWVGHQTWTPQYEGRVAAAAMLFADRLRAADARRMIAESRAAFVLAPCGSQFDGARLGMRARRFGCASVYEPA